MLGFTPLSTKPLSDIPATAGGTVVINQSVGSYIWNASTAVILPLIFSTVAAYTWSGSTSTVALGGITISHSPGIYVYGGTNATGWGPPVFSPNGGAISENPVSFAAISAGQVQIASVNSTPGAYSWAGTTSTLSSAISATPGIYSWLGTTSQIQSLIYASPGTWSWNGTTSILSQLVIASAGTYSWAGTTATTNLNISSQAGAYTWAGLPMTISGMVVTVNQIIGNWTWAGTTAQTSQSMNASVAQYGWNGTNSTVSSYDVIRINETIGNYVWSGTNSDVNPVPPAQNTGSGGGGGTYYISETYEEILEELREQSRHATFVREAAVEAVTHDYYATRKKTDAEALKKLKIIAKDLQFKIDKIDLELLKEEVRVMKILMDDDDEAAMLLL